MQKGECFFGDIRFKGNPHVWIVLSEPNTSDDIAIVNCTTGLGGSKAHKISQADCPSLEYESELAWSEAITVKASGVKKAIEGKKFQARTPMALTTVDKIIREGSAKKLIPKEVSKVIFRK